MKSYDVVVLGLGVMGSAAACSLAKRGVSVLGVDANMPHHMLGSSHGPTRATRETYFEAPEYVPLCQASTELWRLLEADSGASLLDIKGGLYLAPAGHPLLAGVSRAAGQHKLAIESLDREDVARRYPGFALPDGWQALRENGAGILQAPACMDALRDVARRHGAHLRFQCAAHGWRETPTGVEVDLNGETVHAGKVVLTLGPWACEALAGLGLPLTRRRIPVVYFDTRQPELFDSEDFSIYFWASPDGIFAGKPHFDPQGAMFVRHDAGDDSSPDNVRRVVTEDDIGQLARFADKHMPGLNGGIRSAHVCLYTMTPDNHFVIDRHAGMQHVSFAAGFSGHGFKFAPVVGEILADLALDGRTQYPVGFMSASRFHPRTDTTGPASA